MEIDEELRRKVLIRSENICKQLLVAPKYLGSYDLDKNAQGMEIILGAIEHIEWLERFFMKVVRLDEQKGEE